MKLLVGIKYLSRDRIFYTDPASHIFQDRLQGHVGACQGIARDPSRQNALQHLLCVMDKFDVRRFPYPLFFGLVKAKVHSGLCMHLDWDRHGCLRAHLFKYFHKTGRKRCVGRYHKRFVREKRDLRNRNLLHEILMGRKPLRRPLTDHIRRSLIRVDFEQAGISDL